MPGKPKVIRGKKAIFLVDKHPQREQIIEFIMAKKPVRWIAENVKPPIQFGAIQRYKHQVLVPMLRRAEESAKILGLKENIKERPDEPLPEPEKMAEIQRVAEERAPVAVRQAIRDQELLTYRDGRVSALEKRHRRLLTIVHERAEAMQGEAPGASSGFLVKDYKNAGNEVRAVYKFDAPLATAFLDLEKQIAIELGQWQENTPGPMSIQIVCPSTSDPNFQPRVSYASADQITAPAEQIAAPAQPETVEDDIVEMALIQVP